MTDETSAMLPKSLEEKLSQSGVHKKSRYLFILQKIAIALTVIFILLVVLFLGSFILFITRSQQINLLWGFGWPGYTRLIESLPWAIIGLLVLGIAMLEVLGWRYTKLYRRPLFFSVLGIIAVTIIASFLVEKTQIHRSVSTSPRFSRMPAIRGLYRNYAHENWREARFVRVVKENGAMWDTVSPDNVHFVVVITPTTRFPFDDMIVPNDNILVIGPMNKNTITAQGIRKVEPERIPEF